MPVPTEPRFKGAFTVEQTKVLLAPINPRRVLLANGQSHVPFYDVTAHLIRVLGFGNHMVEILDTELVFETAIEISKQGTFEYGPRNDRKTGDKADNPHTWRYDVCYRATVRLSVFDEDHNFVTFFDNTSTGDAQNQTRADGHDLALKSAVSTATKRCAINLGDQFGLSLYNKGSKDALVIGTKVLPKDWPENETPEHIRSITSDPSEGAPEPQSLGIDEMEHVNTADDTAVDPATAERNLETSLGAKPIEEGA